MKTYIYSFLFTLLTISISLASIKESDQNWNKFITENPPIVIENFDPEIATLLSSYAYTIQIEPSPNIRNPFQSWFTSSWFASKSFSLIGYQTPTACLKLSLKQQTNSLYQSDDPSLSEVLTDILNKDTINLSDNIPLTIGSHSFSHTTPNGYIVRLKLSISKKNLPLKVSNSGFFSNSYSPTPAWVLSIQSSISSQ